MTLRLLKLPLGFVSRLIVSTAHVGENGIRSIRVSGVLLSELGQLIDSFRSQFAFPLRAISLMLLRVENDRVQVLVNVHAGWLHKTAAVLNAEKLLPGLSFVLVESE